MNSLKARIVRQILIDGPMPVSTYMALCLFDSEYGYYMTRDPFGRSGDFTTAPEISQMFGELIGAWLVLAWRALGRPAQPVFAEIGPGRGTLAKDVARTIDRLEPDLRAASSFTLIEVSPALARRQAETLQAAGGVFNWINGIEELPRGRPLLIVGNELFDAVPVRQFVKTPSGWRERCVGLGDDGDLAFLAGPGTLDTEMMPPEASTAKDGAIFEVAPAREALLQTIAERIAEDGGAALFFDYGHLQAGLGDTLQAVLKHAYDEPLAHPGEADLTSHVDFAALAESVHRAGLTPWMTPQGRFLLGMGLLERAGRLGATGDADIQARLSGEVERLAGPEAMGELFKVLAFWTAGTAVPGFG